MREWPQWLFTNCVEERLPGPIRRNAAFRFRLRTTKVDPDFLPKFIGPAGRVVAEGQEPGI